MTNHKPSPQKRQSPPRRLTPTLQPSDDNSSNDTNSDQFPNDNTSYSQSTQSFSDSPTLPYIPIAPFPTFRGLADECPDAHISRFTKVCRANNAATAHAMARIFPVTLEGEASLWYDLNIEPYEDLTWDDIKTSFLDAFGSPELPAEALLSELAAIRQGEEESVRSYLLRMQWMMRKLKGCEVSDKMVREIFVGGLRGEIGEVVESNCKGKGSSFREVVSLAMGDVKKKKKKKQSQCQCWKHHCWKKNGIHRNFSDVSANINGD